MSILIVTTPHPVEDHIRELLADLIGPAGATEQLAAEPSRQAVRLVDRPTISDIDCADLVAVIASQPGVALRWAIHRHGLAPEQALIYASESFAMAATAAALAGVRAYDADGLDITALLGDLKIPIDDRIGAGPVGPGPVADLELRDQEEVFGEALRIYRKLPIPGGASAWWDRRVFRRGDDGTESCPPVIDVTGPARILLYGPYVVLPAGRWRATLHFEICEDAARKTYAFQFGAAPELVESVVRLDQGARAVVIEAQMTKPANVEVRVSMLRAAFHGAFRWRGVQIEQL